MTVTRKPQTFHGLEISIVPYEADDFYLTGDDPLFKVKVQNLSMEKRFGKIALRWKLKDIYTKRIITIDIPPMQMKEYDLPREWLYTEGTAIYILKELDTPEKYSEMSDKELEKMISDKTIDIIPLCSYYVKDSGIFEYEKNKK